jgi:hypothetical protein
MSFAGGLTCLKGWTVKPNRRVTCPSLSRRCAPLFGLTSLFSDTRKRAEDMALFRKVWTHAHTGYTQGQTDDRNRYLRTFHIKCVRQYIEIHRPRSAHKHAISIPTAANPPRLRRCIYTLAGAPQGSSKWSHYRSTVLNVVIESSEVLCRLVLLGTADTQKPFTLQTQHHLVTWRMIILSKYPPH